MLTARAQRASLSHAANTMDRTECFYRIEALLLMQALLEQLQPKLLKPHIEPLRARLRTLLESGQHTAEDVRR